LVVIQSWASSLEPEGLRLIVVSRCSSCPLAGARRRAAASGFCWPLMDWFAFLRLCGFCPLSSGIDSVTSVMRWLLAPRRLSIALDCRGYQMRFSEKERLWAPGGMSVDFAVRLKPSASGKPGLPHAGHSDHPVIFSILYRQHLLASPVALRGGFVSRGMDFSVYRPRLRGQAS